MSTPNTAVATTPKQSLSPLDSVKVQINSPKFVQALRDCLPAHITPERQARVLIQCLNKTPKLAECSWTSIANCMLDCSQMGLEPDGRRAHIIPYGNTATLIVDYKGMLELIYRSDKVDFVDAFLVYENELKLDPDLGQPRFSIQYGGDPRVAHYPIIVGERGKVVGAYAIAHIKGVSKPKFVWLTTQEIEDVRQRSRAAQKGPWVSDWGEMAKKTCIRRIAKTLPLSYEINELLMKEIEHEHGAASDESRFRAAKPAKVDVGAAAISDSAVTAGSVTVVVGEPPAEEAAANAEPQDAGAENYPPTPGTHEDPPPDNVLPFPAAEAAAVPPVKPKPAVAVPPAPGGSPEDKEKLCQLCVKHKVTEEQVCKFATLQYKVSPCETIEELWEVAPRKVSQLLADFLTLAARLRAIK